MTFEGKNNDQPPRRYAYTRVDLVDLAGKRVIIVGTTIETGEREMVLGSSMRDSVSRTVSSLRQTRQDLHLQK